VSEGIDHLVKAYLLALYTDYYLLVTVRLFSLARHHLKWWL